MQKSTDADTGTRRSVPCYGLKGWNVVLLLYSSVDKKKCNAMRELELLDVCRWARDDHAVMLWRDVLLSSGFVYTVPSLRIRINALLLRSKGSSDSLWDLARHLSCLLAGPRFNIGRMGLGPVLAVPALANVGRVLCLKLLRREQRAVAEGPQGAN